MAQIIKHRRGSILSLKDVSANIGELVVGTGSIENLSGPVLFVGHTAVNGGYNPVSKIYQGTNAPSISVGSHGSTMDGVPFYSTATQTLYILDKSGNIGMDLTGNIEGNSINSVTISTISGSTSVIGDVNVTNNLLVTGTTSISGATTIDDTLRVTGNSSLEGNLSVTGDTTFNDSVTITGLTDNRLVIVGTGGLLEDSTNLTFDGTTFNIGQGQFEVDNSTGNIRTSGSITMKGNITIGDNQGGDIIDFNGEVSSSIIPSGSNLFDLGSPTNGWKDLYVSGTAYIESINIGSVSLNSLALPDDLTVSGTTILSGSVLVEDLTEKRLVVAGANGQLVDYSGLTFDNGNLNLSGALEVTNIQGTGSLYLKPDLNDSRDFRIYNTAPSDIHIKGNADYSFFGDDTNFLKIDNNATSITIEALSGVTVNTTLKVTGDSSLEGNLDVTGTTTLNGSTYVTGLTDNRIVIVGTSGLLEDDGNFTFDGTELNIGTGNFTVQQSSGNVDTAGTLNVGGNTTLEGSLTVTSSVNLKDTLTVTGASSLESTLTVTGATNLNSTLVVSGSTTIDDTLRVTNNSSLEGTLSVTGATTLFSSLTVNDNETVNGILTVTGNTQLGGNLYVSGNLEVLGSATNVNIQSTTVEIGDNIILVNAYSPFQRYAGITAYDSGSAGNSGSLLYDSLNDYWVFQNSNALTSKIVGVSGTTMGSEASLTNNIIPVAMGANAIKDSLLSDNGTTLKYNTNKFTVESSDGATLIAGNVTLSSGGGADATNKTSAIVFKNSSNVLGYVSTTETTDVLDGILGYKNSNGALVFSTVIDGGGY